MLLKKNQCGLINLKGHIFSRSLLKKERPTAATIFLPCLSLYLCTIQIIVAQYPPTKKNQGSSVIRERKQERKKKHTQRKKEHRASFCCQKTSFI